MDDRQLATRDDVLAWLVSWCRPLDRLGAAGYKDLDDAHHLVPGLLRTDCALGVTLFFCRDRVGPAHPRKEFLLVQDIFAAHTLPVLLAMLDADVRPILSSYPEDRWLINADLEVRPWGRSACF
jgi:hypothetical protein